MASNLSGIARDFYEAHQTHTADSTLPVLWPDFPPGSKVTWKTKFSQALCSPVNNYTLTA